MPPLPDPADLLDILPAGLIVVDANERIVSLNRLASAILGVGAADAVGRLLTDLVTVRLLDEPGAGTIRARAEADGGWHGNVEFQTADGALHRAAMTLRLVTDPALPGGRGAIAVFLETAAPSGEAAVTAAEELRYRALVERSPEALLIHDLDGVIAEANAAAAALLGWPLAELTGMSVADTRRDGVPGLASDLGALETGSSHERDLVMVRRDGALLPVHATWTVTTAGGRRIALLRLRDLTRERRLERTIEELGELARLAAQPDEPEATAERALTIVADALDADCTLLVSHDGTHYTVRAGPGGDTLPTAALERELPRGRIATWRLAADAAPLAVDLAASRSASRPHSAGARILHDAGYRHLWLVPLPSLHQGDGETQALVEAFGILWRDVPSIDFDVARLGQLARLAGAALSNSRLRRQMRLELERRAELQDRVRLAGEVVSQTSDATTVTDSSGRITLFNPAAERLYGITQDEAVGHRFVDLVEVTRLDGTPLGTRGLDEARRTGAWEGRVRHRPILGTRRGESFEVEVRLTAFLDAQGRFGGTIGVNRDVTAAAGLERELATVASISEAAGRARARREVGAAALERFRDTTGAEVGVIVTYDGDRQVVEAALGVDSATLALIEGTLRSESAVAAAVAPPRTVIDTASGGHGETRGPADALLGPGVRRTSVVGLWSHGEAIGYLAIGSRGRDARIPGEAILLQGAALVAGAMETARLVEQLERGLDHERRTSARLESLVTITALPDELTEEALGAFVLERVVSTVGAMGGMVCLEEKGRLRELCSTDADRELSGFAATVPAAELGFWRALSEEFPAYVAAFAGRETNPGAAAIAARLGYNAVAALPIRIGGQLRGAVVLHFVAPIDEIVVDTRTLEALGRIVSIAFANLHLGESLQTALRSERRLSDELRAVQQLTLLGARRLDLAALAQETVASTASVTGASGGVYLLHDPATGRLREVYAQNVDERLRRYVEEHREAERSIVRSYREGPPRVHRFGLRNSAPELVTIAAEAGVSSWTVLPLEADGALAAVVLLLWEEHPAPDPARERLLGALVQVGSIALSNFRLRAQLLASERRYRTLFTDLPDAVLVSDQRGVVVDANDAAARLYGVERQDLVGRHAATLSPHTMRDAGEPQFAAFAARAADGPFLGLGMRADGSTFDAEHEARFTEIDGEPRALVLVRDVSDRERLQRELLQAQKMEALGELVSGVAHELNNPLASVIAFTQLLRADSRLPVELRDDVELVVQEADRTRRIVQNLLDFARQRPPERGPVDVATLVGTVIELHASTLAAGRVTARVDVPADLPAIDADRAQIQQVLVNLVLNGVHAIRSTNGRGTIAICGEAIDQGRAVRLRVVDDGPGVPPWARDRLFMPFFTTKSPGEGTGLGLSVSFGIVAGHGGRLWHEPGPGGRGAAFVMELPAAQRAEEVPPVTAAAPVAGTAAAAPGGRVLVLDDEPSIRTFMGRILGRAGIAALTVGSGDEGLELLEREPVDALVLDHRMAGMDGTEFYLAAVALRPELRGRAIVMSGDVLNPELRAFADKHALGVLPKPFDVATATRAVEELLAGPRQPVPTGAAEAAG